MALIKCPECGRERVSDTAISCPECGYGIKEHFEKKEKLKSSEDHVQIEKEQKLDNDEILEEQSETIEDNLEDTKNKLDEQELLIQEIKKKIEKNAQEAAPITIWGVSWIIITVVLWFVNEEAISFFLIISFLCAAIGWFLSNENHKEKLQLSEDLAVASESMEKYKKLLEKRKFEYEVTHPKCPNCGRRNTRKISTASRMVSIGLVSVASAKLGKQYECNDCGHMW